MAKKLIDKTEQKRQQWVDRTSELLHVSEETTRHLLSIERQQSIRVNTLKTSMKEVVPQLAELGWKGQPYTWCADGLTVTAGLEEIKNSNLSIDGSIYIQNAASWLPVLALDARPGENILDICSAPGGKTSHIAAITANKAHITANDNSKPRLTKIRANMERLGAQNITYTLFDGIHLSHKLYGRQYDKVLLDVPCSGEGMMTIDNDKDFATWSVAHVKRLQQLQKRILVQAWQLLKPGGTLVYSTCTMAPEEDEAVIDYLLRHNQDAHVQQIKADLPNRVAPVMSWNGKRFDDQLKFAVRLIPSPEVEAFFVCKLTKLDNTTYGV